jgi:hypothetical protein
VFKSRISSVVSGVALAVGLGALAFASQASATDTNPTSPDILLKSATMVTTYTANVGTNASNQVDAYSNGVTFSYQNSNALGQPIGGTSATVYTLYGFCVDITHDMFINTPLGYTYADTYTPVTGPIGDPLPTDLDSPTAHPISPAQLTSLTKLIDTGWLLHEGETGQNQAYINNANLQLAAIQAAIWKVEGGFVTLNNQYAVAGANVGGAITGAAPVDTVNDPSGQWTYLDYFNAYSTGAFTNLGDDNDSFYTIQEVLPTQGGNQAFAIGWPLPGVPEPATWAMMLVGFGGLGAMLRLRRRRVALTA